MSTNAGQSGLVTVTISIFFYSFLFFILEFYSLSFNLERQLFLKNLTDIKKTAIKFWVLLLFSSSIEIESVFRIEFLQASKNDLCT